MKELMRRIFDKKAFHLGVILFIIFVVLFVSGLIVIRYQVEGETNMPFNLSKITVVSVAEKVDKDEKVEGNRWNYSINQNNDIYMYIEKNKNYDKVETIKQIEITNVELSKENDKGELKLYKPDTENPNVIFSNKDEYSVQSLTYTVKENTDMKNLVITNQGGTLTFRVANNNIAEYVSNDEQINYNELLSKANVTLEQLKCKVKFDLIITLDSGKIYKSVITLDLPLDGVIEQGTASKEFTDMQSFVFKRIKN